MSVKRYTIEQVRNIVAVEGLGYAIESYMSADRIEAATLDSASPPAPGDPPPATTAEE